MRYTRHSKTRRAKSGFLLFPRTIGRKTRWLEYAKWEEMWVDSNGYGGGWFGNKWLDGKPAS